MFAHSNDPVSYNVKPASGRIADRSAEDQQTVEKALEILRKELQTVRTALDSPQVVRSFLVMHNGCATDLHVEQFSVLFLDSQNRYIDCETLFTGTLTQTSVYPHEVVRAALRHNAAGVIFTHNHPSGAVQPSRADEALTQALKAALALVDVRVLDHFITAGPNVRSMAEMGLV